ncbi:MAG TPA: cytochrome c oxidase subunit 3, partial [Ramlibacter sp.]
MSTSAPGTKPYYFVPQPSRHPAFAAFGLFWIILGAQQWINGAGWGRYLLFFGFAWLFGVLFQWFRDTIRESEGGRYGHKIDLSFR